LSESTQSATVTPSTGGGGVSGTPIQTDIGKLIVIYQPDADPYYPSFSKRAGEQGEVVVRLIIDETGVVEDARLLQSSSYPRLDRAAMEIGKRYRFKPYLINGSPTKISTNLLIKFNINKKSPYVSERNATYKIIDINTAVTKCAAFFIWLCNL